MLRISHPVTHFAGFAFEVLPYSLKMVLWGLKHVGVTLTYLLTLLTYLHTHSLTPCRRVLERPTGFQLGKKFPAFYGTLRYLLTYLFY